MTMQELNHKTIKISARSITVKDENNKTRGIVRMTAFKDCRPNLQMEAWKIVKEAKAKADLNKIFYSDNKWWYIHDIKWDENYFKYFENRDSNMDKKYKEKQNTYEALVNENAMEVIECYII